MEVENSKYLNFTRQPDFQQILTNPILDIAARFWEADRYDAFRVFYRSMRVIDDFIDDRKTLGQDIPADEKIAMTVLIEGWLADFENRKCADPFLSDLSATADKFQMPRWPWRRLSEAMIYDLGNNGFENFATFLRYAEGAAIAPASVFMHLCGVSKENDSYRSPSFDIRKAARPLAIFSYLVHIIRDFRKDQLAGLNYFADNLLEEYGLDRKQLSDIARGSEISTAFSDLMKRYIDFTAYYQIRAEKSLLLVKPALSPQYQLSLNIIYQLYLQIFEKIDFNRGNFSMKELNPTPQEVHDRISQTVKAFKPME